ncbi:hypothetical protein KY334_06625, partial [Candidatus Woesearchaeota archaeon]|nr:hypothetical protein [Candidatus Woesearchaeota archaeon]
MNSRNVKILKIISILLLVVIFSTSVLAASRLDRVMDGITSVLSKKISLNNYDGGESTAQFWVFLAVWGVLFGFIYALLTSEKIVGEGKPLAYMGNNPKIAKVIALCMAILTIYTIPISWFGGILIWGIILLLGFYGFRMVRFLMKYNTELAKENRKLEREDKADINQHRTEMKAIKETSDILDVDHDNPKKVMDDAIENVDKISFPSTIEEASLTNVASILSNLAVSLPVFKNENIKFVYESDSLKGPELLKKINDKLSALKEFVNRMRSGNSSKDYEFYRTKKENLEKQYKGEIARNPTMRREIYHQDVSELEDLRKYIDNTYNTAVAKINSLESSLKKFETNKDYASLDRFRKDLIIDKNDLEREIRIFINKEKTILSEFQSHLKLFKEEFEEGIENAENTLKEMENLSNEFSKLKANIKDKKMKKRGSFINPKRQNDNMNEIKTVLGNLVKAYDNDFKNKLDDQINK